MAPRATPTPIPAFAPVLRPETDVCDVSVLDNPEPVRVDKPELENSELVGDKSDCRCTS